MILFLLLSFIPALASEGWAVGRVIVAFGDSITAGYGVSANEAYPVLLARRIKQEGYAYRVINAGVSGETSAGGLMRLQGIIAVNPEIVILELGANDGLRGFDLRYTEENLSTIIEQLQKKNILVILAGMKIPVNYGVPYRKAFEAVYSRLATRYQPPFIPFFLEGVAGHPALNQGDDVHPTAEGYRVIVDHIWPVIKPLLKR